MTDVTPMTAKVEHVPALFLLVAPVCYVPAATERPRRGRGVARNAFSDRKLPAVTSRRDLEHDTVLLLNQEILDRGSKEMARIVANHACQRERPVQISGE